MSRQIWFTTNRFKPVPGETRETNLSRYGKALAGWVRERLVERGYAIRSEDIVPEDWGWLVRVQREPFSLSIGCGNEDGSKTRWSLFVEARQGFLQKLFKRADPTPAVSELERHLEEIVREEPDFMDVEM